MSALIIRMPEEKRERLKSLAKSRNVSVNKLIEETDRSFGARTHRVQPHIKETGETT